MNNQFKKYLNNILKNSKNLTLTILQMMIPNKESNKYKIFKKQLRL